jgi:hypothetical protein
MQSGQPFQVVSSFWLDDELEIWMRPELKNFKVLFINQLSYSSAFLINIFFRFHWEISFNILASFSVKNY